MNQHGVLYCPPGELIECSFTNGSINDGKIKILVKFYIIDNTLI
jgi:hypothetical protein